MERIKKFWAMLMIAICLVNICPLTVYAEELPPSTEDGIGDTETEIPEEDVEDSEENTENTDDTQIPDEELEEVKKWVVVLDPGHGGIDGGASRTINGVSYVERDLVLKIAYYCKAELEKYDNVVVYMTRTDNSSPSMDRQQRAYYAATVGADVLISLHLNATNATTTYSYSGAEIYYQNLNYKSDVSYAGLQMSQSILSQLQGIGVPNNGAKVRYTEDNTLYPDGSKGDYLGINYWSKMYGYPGILIEHAYINNPSDVTNFLSSEQWLQALGIADARGIMKSLNSGQFVYQKGMAGRWVQSSNGRWWFEYATGGWPESQWLRIWGKWYYFDAAGYMASGWQYIDGAWYYLGAANDGAMKTGWQYINNKWYYLSSSGAMCSGWIFLGGNWYYLGSPNDGSMKTGWQLVNGVWYYMYENGDMAHSTWIGRYYVNETGAWVATK